MSKWIRKSKDLWVRASQLTTCKCFGRVRGGGVKTSSFLPFDVLFVGGEAYTSGAKAAVVGVRQTKFLVRVFNFVM